jgi:Rrf2 family transcriptional regulator, repressor of oqxAB
MIDVRFPTALQLMLSLALAQERDQGLLTSADLARSLGANPSFVRKMLVPLTDAGMVECSLGLKGGVRLALPAEQITLRSIYETVVKNKPLWSPREGVPSICLVSSNISPYFSRVAAAAEEAALAKLGESTLADGLAELHGLDAAASTSNGL